MLLQSVVAEETAPAADGGHVEGKKKKWNFPHGKGEDGTWKDADVLPDDLKDQRRNARDERRKKHDEARQARRAKHADRHKDMLERREKSREEHRRRREERRNKHL